MSLPTSYSSTAYGNLVLEHILLFRMSCDEILLTTECPSVIVATPGRLWEHFREHNPHLRDLSQLRFFVIDEADKMVKHGHYQVTLC